MFIMLYYELMCIILMYNVYNGIFCQLRIMLNHFRPDYAPWSGPDPNLLSKEQFPKSAAMGHDAALVSGSYLAKGPNAELRKGPLRGLAEGSIYSQRNLANTESRGK